MDGIGKLLAVFLLVTAILALAGPAVAQKVVIPLSTKAVVPVESTNKDMMATVKSMNNTTLMAALMNSSGIDNMIVAGNIRTLLLPDDAALEKYGADKVNLLLNDRRAATGLLIGLGSIARVTPSSLIEGNELTMVNGKKIPVKIVNGKTMIGGSKVTRVLQTTNGIIYMIDSLPA